MKISTREIELQENQKDRMFICSKGKIQIARSGKKFSSWPKILMLEKDLILERLGLDLKKNRLNSMNRLLMLFLAGLFLSVIYVFDSQPCSIGVLGVTFWRALQAFNQLAPALYQAPMIRQLHLEWLKATKNQPL
jgi:hypothetical protein